MMNHITRMACTISTMLAWQWMAIILTQDKVTMQYQMTAWQMAHPPTPTITLVVALVLPAVSAQQPRRLPG